MTFFYTIRAKFGKALNADDLAWTKYIEWSRLAQLTELVSLDTGLNEVLVEPDRDSDEDWKEIVFEDCRETGFFRTFDYVLRKTKEKMYFNLLAIVIEPESDCSLIQLDDYDFLGYELLDQYYDTSALTNCGGFDETFLPTELNQFGLFTDFERACEVSRLLLENNPMEDHADTNVIAIWRHRTIGW
jgi:hypothetical protein